ncbi:ABC transporter permease [Sphaerisporangium sp. B11E5]|uniref:ABC transporter permease n=1 Tax=Sphaerisporangium sp. B11E5 TaxID=3153563 RepID=UPI00325D2744
MLLTTEALIYLREPMATFMTLGLPIGLLLGLGLSIPDFRVPLPEFGGQRVVDTQLPAMMIILSVSTSAFSAIPAALAVYRERGILRRLSVTPVPPSRLLGAQLVVNLASAVVATALTIVMGHLLLDSRLPAQLGWFAVSFVLGVGAMFAIGLLLAAAIPSSRAAGAIGAVVMFPLLFLGGMWVPREAMPELLRQISDFTPTGPFGQTLRDAWAGTTPEPLHLAVLAAWTLLASIAAARLFRWE